MFNGSLHRKVMVCLFSGCVLFAARMGVAQGGEGERELAYYRGIGIQPLVEATQSGELAPGTYLIPHDLLIEKGKVLTIFAGSTILFTQNAMLVVNGKLVCSGTAEAPIVFRRLDNQKYFQPIDSRVEIRWDGIYLPDSAKLEMKNTIVSDSKYGIVISGKDVAMVFDSVLFINNKFQNVKIGNQVMKIDENTPVVFRYPEQRGVFVEPAVVKYATETIQNKKGKKQHKTNYPKLRVSMGIMGIAGLAGGIAGVVAHKKYSESYEKKKDEGDLEMSKAGRIAAAGGAVLFGIGAAGFTWTFFY